MICFLCMKTCIDLFSVFFLACAARRKHTVVITDRPTLTAVRGQPDVTKAPFFDDVTVENNNVK